MTTKTTQQTRMRIDYSETKTYVLITSVRHKDQIILFIKQLVINNKSIIFIGFSKIQFYFERLNFLVT